MDEVREIFKIDHILYNVQINRLLEIIFRMFDIPGIPHLKLDNTIAWGMVFFKNEPYNFYLNWHILGANIKNKSIKEANYWIFFYCLHEVIHHRQLILGITGNEKVREIMDKNYSYIEEVKSGQITQVFHKIMYRMYHDFFPLEINADILAYIKLLEILKEIDLEYYEVFLNYFKKRVESIYEDDKLYDIYNVLLEIDGDFENYSLEEKIIYGMPISRRQLKDLDIIQLIK